MHIRIYFIILILAITVVTANFFVYPSFLSDLELWSYFGPM